MYRLAEDVDPLTIEDWQGGDEIDWRLVKQTKCVHTIRKELNWSETPCFGEYDISC